MGVLGHMGPQKQHQTARSSREMRFGRHIGRQGRVSGSCGSRAAFSRFLNDVTPHKGGPDDFDPKKIVAKPPFFVETPRPMGGKAGMGLGWAKKINFGTCRGLDLSNFFIP